MSTQQIVLQGPGPWGFRLVGGKDFEQPLAISRVRNVRGARGSRALLGRVEVHPKRGLGYWESPTGAGSDSVMEPAGTAAKLAQVRRALSVPFHRFADAGLGSRVRQQEPSSFLPKRQKRGAVWGRGLSAGDGTGLGGFPRNVR